MLRSALLVTLAATTTLMMSACATTAAAPAAGSDLQIELYGQLVNDYGTLKVKNICHRIERQEDSKYPRCDDDEMRKGHSRYFNLATLSIVASEDIYVNCKTSKEYCDQFQAIYDSPKFSETRKLEPAAFQAAVASAISDTQRIDILRQEKEYRAAAPARAAAKAAEEAERSQRRKKDQIRIDDQRRLAKDRAESEFLAASKNPKKRGDLVCSADNRIGDIEEVAGSRVRVSVRSIAAIRTFGFAPRYTEPVGPFETALIDPRDLGHSSTMVAIRDRHYLFHPGLDVTFVSQPAQLWDESSNWAGCSYRFSR